MRALPAVALILLALVAANADAQDTVQQPPTEAVAEPTPTDTHSPLSAAIVIDGDVTGELSVLDADGRLVTRVVKSDDHSFTVRLEPGRYTVSCVTDEETARAEIVLGTGEEVVVNRSRLIDATCHDSRRWRRHRPRAPRADELDLRPWRLTFDAGFWSSDTSDLPTITITDDSLVSDDGGFLGGISLGHRMTPDWMLNLRLDNRILEADDYDLEDGQHVDRIATLASFEVGIRYYLPPLATRSTVKPYLSAGIGPTLALDITDRHHRRHHDDWHNGDWHDGDDVRTMVAVGGHIGVGVDMQVSSWLVFGTDVAYRLTSNFSEPLAGQEDGNGFTFAFQFGVNLGRRMKKPAR